MIMTVSLPLRLRRREQCLRRKLLRPRANVELMSILIHSHTTIIVILHWNAREQAHLFVFSRLSAYTCNSEYKYCSRRAFLWNALLQTENRERQYTPHSVGEDTVASPVISRSSNCFIHWRLYSSLAIPPFLTTLFNPKNILKRRLQGIVVFVCTRPNSKRYREWVGPTDYYM